ncbi:serine hydrolase domain-containing protein [Winogradskyella sp. J14-2]|uniref:serine hydrolase domain-containing protein n=1 Tax=Winogradskyella sp. J14-2 TaxID=1936080 RepID=UPI0009FB5424|nr:serine hydrolase domain-containing protein [Winogradskyella sp. J14-2]
MKRTLIFTLLFLGINAYSQKLEQPIIDKLDSQIEKYIDGISPGMAVGIVKDGVTVFEKYIGYSNLEHDIKIDENTRFNIASNAKQFTALCILRLIEQDKIALDDDVRKYLPELYKEIGHKITVSNLLTHTSGIRDVYGLWALKGKDWYELFIDNDDAIELLKSQTDLNFEPGKEYLYSNSNYILLTEIIEKVTDTKFKDFSNSLFTEIGMGNSSFLTNYMAIIPNKARPYGNWNGWKEYPVVTELIGDGGLFTTLEDQLKWEQVIQQNNGKNLSTSIISESQSTIDDVDFDNYGYGLMFGKYKGLNYTYHDGSTGAYNATFFRLVDKNLAIVIMSNNGNVPTNYLAKQLTDIVLELDIKNEIYPSNPEKTERLKDFKNVVGNYQNDEGTIIKISEKEGELFREIYQRDPVKMISEKQSLFHYETNYRLKMNFSEIGTEQQKLTLYLSTQKPSIYYKLPKENLESGYGPSLNGTYFNNETDTEIIIEHVRDDNYNIIKNGRRRDGKLITKDYLRMMSSYKIRVIRDRNGNIQGLNLENGRIKNVIFKKESL